MFETLGPLAAKGAFSATTRTATDHLKKFLDDRNVKKQIDELAIGFTKKALQANVNAGLADRFEGIEVKERIFDYVVDGEGSVDALAISIVPEESQTTLRSFMAEFISQVEAIIVAALPLHARVVVSQIHKQGGGYEARRNEKLDEIIAILTKKEGIQRSNELAAWCDPCHVRSLLDDSISELGPRYTAEVNVETGSLKAFDALMENETIYERGDQVLKELSASVLNLALCIEGLRADAEWDKACCALKEVESHIDRVKSLRGLSYSQGIDDIIGAIETFDNNVTYDMGQYAEKKLSNYVTALEGFREGTGELYRYAREDYLRVLGRTALVVSGPFGVGKSHLLADACRRVVDSERIAFLVLGAYFQNQVSPLDQVMRSIAPGIEPNVVLEGISEATGDDLALIAIDALNEGVGQFLWRNWIRNFVNQIKTYPNLRLVFSVRSPLEPTVFPEGFLEAEEIASIKHEGFRSDLSTALERYCVHYDLALPAFPMFGDEICNPFYLKLACQVFADQGAQQFAMTASLSDLMNAYLARTDRRLSLYPGLDLSCESGISREMMCALVSDEEYEDGRIPWERAKETAEHVGREYGVMQAKKLAELFVSEGLLMRVRGYDGTDYAVPAFERLGFFVEASSLLDDLHEEGARDAKAIIQSKKFKTVIKEQRETRSNDDLFEMLAVLLPERFDTELVEVLPQDILDGEQWPWGGAQYWIISSLQWRAISVLPETLVKYIEDHIVVYEDTLRLLLMRLVGCAINPRTAMNAVYLNDLLSKMSLKARDAYWTTTISIDYLESPYKPLDVVEWVWANAKRLNEESSYLASVVLSWFLASTNPFLRDRSTKALAALLSLNTKAAQRLADILLDFGDDYILERVCAALLGAFWNSEYRAQWGDVVRAVYEKLFATNGAYPNIMVRDYAGSLIEAYINTGLGSFDDFPAVMPPYESEWDERCMSCEEIDALEQEIAEKYGERSNQESAMWHMSRSMTTEHGRGCGGYGDFGRYVFGSAMREWNNQWNDQDLANMVLTQIIEDFYDFDLHSEFDVLVGRMASRTGKKVERIGKKYQRIGMHRMLARLVDNHPPYNVEYQHKVGYEEAYKEAHVYDHLSFLALIGRTGGDDYIEPTAEQRAAREAWNEEEWIESEEHIIFEPWRIRQILLDQRDIDPTYIWQEAKPNAEKSLFVHELLVGGEELSDTEWLHRPLIDEETERFKVLENEEGRFVVLACHPKRRGEVRAITVLSCAVLFRKGSEDAFVKDRRGSTGNGVPEREYMYCFLYDHYDAYASKTTRESFDREAFDDEKDMIIAAQTYEWAHERDASFPDEERPYFFLPAPELIEAFGLRLCGRGDWLDRDGKLIAFDASMRGYEERALLFDAELLEAFCMQNGLSMGWGEFIEKEVEGVHHSWWRAVVGDGKGGYSITIDGENTFRMDKHSYSS